MSYFGYTGLKDESGVGYGVKHVNNKIRTSSMPYPYDIAEGNVANHWAWSKMGYTPKMTTTESDLWSKAGTYVFCTTAGKWEVVSTDNTQDIGTVLASGTSTGGTTTTLVDSGANFVTATVAVGDAVILDKSGTTPEYGWVTAVTSATELAVAGGFSSGGTGSTRAYSVIDKSAHTGAQVVKIAYLTNAFAEKTEMVILNGTSAVDTVNTDLYRVNSFRVIVAGTDLKSKGNLSLQADGAGNTYSYITAGFTRARSIIYTIPASKNLYITDINWSYGYSTNQTHYARMYTRATYNDGFITQGIFYPYTETVLSNSSETIHLTFPTKIPSGVDIRVS